MATLGQHILNQSQRIRTLENDVDKLELRFNQVQILLKTILEQASGMKGNQRRWPNILTGLNKFLNEEPEVIRDKYKDRDLISQLIKRHSKVN